MKALLLLFLFSTCVTTSPQFYHAIGPQALSEYASLCGLDQCPDLDSIEKTLENSQNILEIGGGYGRIIDKITQKYLSKQITAIEPAEANFKYLEEKFKTQPHIHLYQQNILEHSSQKPYDLVLWMWSGLADLDFKEQKDALHKIYALVGSQGTLVIDLPEMQAKNSAQENTQGTSWKVETPSGIIYQGYLPTEETLFLNGFAAGFSSVQKIPYTTPKKNKRILYLFVKSS